MKKTLTSLCAAAALLVSGAVLADRPGDDWIPIEQAIQAAQQAGYTTISEIEADDDHWEGEGYKQDGEKYKFKIDAKTGQVVKDDKQGMFR